MRKAFGDLHKRLIHLTSYVSGMVIIGGNNSAAQSRFLRDFISEQDDAVNLAYIHAKAETTEAQYRQQLSSQLLGLVGGDVNTPLSQQLGSLLGHEQQVLIAISGAEQLSNKLIKELWHLARNAESIDEGHMSIILTGEQTWADSVRHHLDGANLPVFVPYDFQQTDPAASAQPVSELEQMIADKRRAFSERLSQRQSKDKRSLSARQWRLMALATLVFIGCFGGLLWLFYPQLGGQSASPSSNSVAQAEPRPTTPEPVTEAKAEPDIQEQPDDMPDTARTTTEDSSGDKVVADWQSAVNALPSPESDVASEEDNQDKSSSPDTESEPDSGAQVAEPPTTPEKAVSSGPNYFWDEKAILALPAGDYVLQLSAASQEAVLTDFRREHRLTSARRYQTRRYGGEWHVLIAGQTYPDLAAARQALQRLPMVLQREGAFAKKVSQVHKEIEQGYADGAQQP